MQPSPSSPTLDTSTSSPFPQITTLILVCCHAIYLGGGTTYGHDESEWLIEPFQKGETATFIRHIEEGVKLLKESEGTGILVFSGGPTKEKRCRELGKEGRTEAQGYLDIALSNDLFGYDDHPQDLIHSLRHRIFTEDYATDSFQNVLFSLLQFPIWVRKYHDTVAAAGSMSQTAPDSTMGPYVERKSLPFMLPPALHLVSHAFKRSRFLDLHVPAVLSLLRYSSPAQMQTLYTGIDPPFTPETLAAVIEGDRLRGYGLWNDDLLGTGQKVRSKRAERGWSEDRRWEFLDQTLREWYGEGIVRELKDWM